MAGSIFGKNFTVTTWGESHGQGLGVVVDGCPAGLDLDESVVQTYLNRRKPGTNPYTTPRKEGDCVRILSGLMDGKTTGTPISMVVMNENQRSVDYTEIASYYRPGHADYTFDQKYGFRDYRGGGRSSGRETIGRVAGGAVAAAILKELGIEVTAYAKSIGPVEIDYERFDKEYIVQSPVSMPDKAASEEAEKYLKECMKEQDSSGGVIECVVTGMPAGIGETVFDKLDACLGKAILSIGSVKGFEIGSGFAAGQMKGSEQNDAFYMQQNGKAAKKTNHAGGILGGMSDGSDIILRAAIKPTPSIAKEQMTIDRQGEERSISIKGRHDPVIVPRAVVVVETMAAMTLVDLLFANMSARMDRIVDFYRQ